MDLLRRLSTPLRLLALFLAFFSFFIEVLSFIQYTHVPRIRNVHEISGLLLSIALGILTLDGILLKKNKSWFYVGIIAILMFIISIIKLF